MKGTIGVASPKVVKASRVSTATVTVASIFTKNRGENISSANVEEEKMRKANALFDSMNLFGKVPLNSK